jgi:hypothetical protein
MRLKIRCDEECEKFCKILEELNWALDATDGSASSVQFIVSCRLPVSSDLYPSKRHQKKFYGERLQRARAHKQNTRPREALFRSTVIVFLFLFGNNCLNID